MMSTASISGEITLPSVTGYGVPMRSIQSLADELFKVAYLER